MIRFRSSCTHHSDLYQVKWMISPFPCGLLEGQLGTVSHHSGVTEPRPLPPVEVQSIDHFFFASACIPWAPKWPKWRCQMVYLELLWSELEQAQWRCSRSLRWMIVVYSNNNYITMTKCCIILFLLRVLITNTHSVSHVVKFQTARSVAATCTLYIVHVCVLFGGRQI